MRTGSMKIERSWTYVALTLAGGIIGGALSSHFWPAAGALAAERKARTITADRFVVTDSSGTQRALLSTQPDGDVTLSLNDISGKERAELRVAASGGASVGFFD